MLKYNKIIILIYLIILTVNANMKQSVEFMNVSVSEPTGLAVDENGYLLVTGATTTNLIEIKTSTIIRRDGPFRSMSTPYVTYYSDNQKEFFVLGSEKARVGRFSSVLVGEMIDYFYSFHGNSTLFLYDDLLIMGAVPYDNKNDSCVKMCGIENIPRQEESIVTTDNFLNETDKNGTFKNYTILSVGKGAAVIKKEKGKDSDKYIFVIGEFKNDNDNTIEDFVRVFKYDQVKNTIDNENILFTKSLGDLSNYGSVEFHYDETKKWMFVMTKHSSNGVLVIKMNDFKNIGDDVISPPNFNYISVTDTESFGSVIRTITVNQNGEDTLAVVISAPKAKVKFNNEEYTLGVVYQYFFYEEHGFVFQMYSLPPLLENEFGYGSGLAIYNRRGENNEETKVYDLYITAPGSSVIYKTIIPYCGDGEITTEIGEECDPKNNEVVDEEQACTLCLCGDGYVADENNICQYKCERDTCYCDKTNPCTKCTILHLDIETRCQECERGYVRQGDKCVTKCGDGIRTEDEECDRVDYCQDDCLCYVGYEKDPTENRCVIMHETVVKVWIYVLVVIVIIGVIIMVIYIVFTCVKKTRSKLDFGESGENGVYAAGQTTKIDTFRNVEEERHPLYNIENSQYLYSISEDLAFYEEDKCETRDQKVEQLEVKKRYIFEIFVGNDSINSCTFELTDSRLDQSDYELSFTPPKGSIHGGDILCVRGKVCPNKEGTLKSEITLTVTDLNSAKMYAVELPFSGTAVA